VALLFGNELTPGDKRLHAAAASAI